MQFNIDTLLKTLNHLIHNVTSQTQTFILFLLELSSQLLRNPPYSSGKCIDASPLVVFNETFVDGLVVIGSHSHIVLAVSFISGEVVWKTELPDRVESSAVVCGQGGRLVAVGESL